MNEITIKFHGQIYYSLEDFARNMYLYSDEAFTILKSQKFLKILYKINQNLYNTIAELLRTPFQQDALVFKAQYLLNPLMVISYHGYRFNSFQALGKKILSFAPSIDIYLKDFLKYHLLTFYMEKTKYDFKEPKLYQEVKKLEDEFLINENRAYFKLGFLLEGSGQIFYHGKKFSSPQEFLSHAKEGVNIIDFASSMVKSQYIFACLEYLHYDQEISLFETMVHLIEQKEKENDNLRKV